MTYDLDRDFRLPKNVRPTRFDLRIEADLEDWKYTASERIDCKVLEATDTIALHAIDLNVTSAQALVNGVTHQATVMVEVEAEAIVLKFAEALPVGEAQIQLTFDGVILDRLRGFYRSEKDGQRFAVTQFEAADARRAFPCFDEPEFKARYALALVIPPKLTAISNSPIVETKTLENDRQEVRFAETPPISSYLVAFCIGPFEATVPATTTSGIPVRVIVPPGMADKGIYARDAHVAATQYLEAYTDFPYPYKKVDAIGIPDFEAGAMENPGAITYRMTELVADADRASTGTLKSIYYTASHELTHMWWGDLVTMAWWNDLWLNESFATLIGYKVTTDLNPEWDMWRDFVANLARPFSLDALVSTHPISFEVKNAKQATERFDVITYWKGAGVVRMIENFLGADTFRAGVRTYLKRYKETNATADDFWRELSQASDQDVAAIAHAWIKEPGHPVVRAVAKQVGDDLQIDLQQERFFSDPEAAKTMDAQIWPIPLVIKYGTGENIAEQHVLFDKAQMSITLPNAQWFFLNGGASGFYRAAMDETSLENLVKVLQQVLAPHERLSLIDNQWALLKAGQIPVHAFLTLLDGYRTETDRAVLSTMTEHLSWLSTHVVTDEARPKFEAFVQKHYGPHFETLGWEPISDESVDVRMKRAVVLGALGGIARDQSVRVTAREQLEKYFGDSSLIDPNLASVVAALAARDGDHELYERYLARKRQAVTDPEEEERFLYALTAFENAELIQRTLELAMTDDVRSQDRAFVLASLLARRVSRDTAWQFVRDHWDEIAKSIDPMMLQGLLRSFGHLTHEPVATEVRQFLVPRITDQTRETIAQVDERLRIDSATVTRLVKTLEAALS